VVGALVGTAEGAISVVGLLIGKEVAIIFVVGESDGATWVEAGPRHAIVKKTIINETSPARFMVLSFQTLHL
jgi:hypothetical protein